MTHPFEFANLSDNPENNGFNFDDRRLDNPRYWGGDEIEDEDDFEDEDNFGQGQI